MHMLHDNQSPTAERLGRGTLSEISPELGTDLAVGACSIAELTNRPVKQQGHRREIHQLR